MSKQLRIWLFVLLGTLLTSTSLLAEGVITMTTSRAFGELIPLKIEANGNVTIEGIKEAPQIGDELFFYTLTNQTITIRGDVTTLNCNDTQLTSLDVSGCTALTELYCNNNQLTSLDVSGSTALTSLSCYNNQLTSLDLSGCTALTKLD
ncbi:leucine-rich repeat domain-containing protein, partial [Porphyromonas sp.]